MLERGRLPSLNPVLRKNSKDITGEVFGRLTALEYHGQKRGPSGYAVKMWLCRCDCGNYKMVSQKRLTARDKNRTTSCGCYAKELLSAHRKQARKWAPEERAIRRVYSSYRNTRTAKKLGFFLDYEEFLSFVSSSCAYCGAPPQNETTFSGDLDKIPEVRVKYNGLDRVNNGVGYTADNVVSCCESCNRAKLAMTLDKFSSWVDRISMHKTFIGWLLPEPAPSEELATAA